MAGILGRLREFDAMLEPWDQYVGHFLDANGITNIDKKRSELLSAIGPAPYKLLTSLISPQKPGEKSYEELVTLLTEHYNPVPSEIVERYRFHTRIRHEGEAVSTFVAELPSLARYYKFGALMTKTFNDATTVGREDIHLGFSIGYCCGHGKCKEERDRATNPCTKTDRGIQSYYHEQYTVAEIAAILQIVRHVKCLTCGKTGHIKRWSPKV